VLQSLDALGVQDLASGTVRISVAAGAVVGGVSRVDNASGDPITFAVSTQPPPPGGLAPADIVGRSYTFTAIDPVAGLVVSEVAFESATTGTIFEFGENRPFTYADYETVTDLATMVMTIPARQVENMRVILEWSGADEGIFAGVVETPRGSVRHWRHLCRHHRALSRVVLGTRGVIVARGAVVASSLAIGDKVSDRGRGAWPVPPGIRGRNRPLHWIGMELT
jgi:hypothetical protein